MLDHENDSYNGVIINEKGLPKDKDAFKRALESSLEAWRLEGRKGVWLKVINCGKHGIVGSLLFSFRPVMVAYDSGREDQFLKHFTIYPNGSRQRVGAGPLHAVIRPNMLERIKERVVRTQAC